MSRLSINVPVELVRMTDEGGIESFSIVIKNNDGQEASFDLVEMCQTSIAWDIALSWASEKMTEALINRRRQTGMYDANGQMICEGDILLVQDYQPGQMPVPMLVKWTPDLCAFTMNARYIGGAGVRSENLAGAHKHKVIGNVFENEELLTPIPDDIRRKKTA